MKPNFNCILIDITKFEKSWLFEEFLVSCNLQDKIDYGKLWSFCKNGNVYKVWFDATTFQMIGYSTKNQQNFTNEFTNFLQNMKPIEEGTKFEFENDSKIELTVDNILDKIRIKGVDSLTNEEKGFLESI